MMDKETWLFSDEIIDSGFACEIEDKKTELKAKEDIVLMAKMQIENSIKIMKQSESAKKDVEKVAAMLQGIQNNIQPQIHNEINNGQLTAKIEEEKEWI